MQLTYRAPQEGGILCSSAQLSILFFRSDKRKLDDLLLPRKQDPSSVFDFGSRVTHFWCKLQFCSLHRFFHHSGDSNHFLNTESKKFIFISVYFHLLLWKVEQLWRNFATSLKQWILQLIALTCLAWFIILGTTFVLQVETMFLQMSPTLPVLGQPNPFFLSAALLKKVKMEFLHHPVSQMFGNVSNRIGWRHST